MSLDSDSQSESTSFSLGLNDDVKALGSTGIPNEMTKEKTCNSAKV